MSPYMLWCMVGSLVRPIPLWRWWLPCHRALRSLCLCLPGPRFRVATLCYAGLALRFGSDDQHEEDPAAPSPAVVSIQADSEKATLLPKPSDTDGEADRSFNSGDAYSAMYFLQSIAVTLLFALMPMFAQKNGVSTDRQFFWEEVGCLLVAIIANVGFVVDGFRSRATAKAV